MDLLDMERGSVAVFACFSYAVSLEWTPYM